MSKEYEEVKTIQESPFGFSNTINELLRDGWELHGEPNIMEMVFYPKEGEVFSCSQKDLIITQVLKR